MAGSDGQVVFTVELDDTAFMEGMLRLQTTLAALGQSTVSALSIGEAGLSDALISGGQWVTSFAAGVSGNKGATTAVKNAVSAAATAARATANSGGYSVGQNMVAGIISGASSKGASLNATLANIVKNALTAAKRAAGIASPSKLFHDEVGQYLALGVQSGFVDTMQSAVLPAIGQSVSASVAAGRKALGGALLSSVQGALNAGFVLPEVTDISAAVLRGSAVQSPAGVTGAQGGNSVVNVTQHITFESTMQAPDEIARAIRRQATYGLAGARG